MGGRGDRVGGARGVGGRRALLGLHRPAAAADPLPGRRGRPGRPACRCRPPLGRHRGVGPRGRRVAGRRSGARGLVGRSPRPRIGASLGSRRRPPGTRPATRRARSAAAPMRRSRRGAGRRRPAAGKSSASISPAIRAWQRAGRPDESQRCATRRDLAEGRFNRAAEALEEMGDLPAAADAWAKAADAGQPPLTPRPLPLPDAARRSWSEGGKAARLARAPAPRRGPWSPGRPSTRVVGARVRALVCSARVAEDAGRFEAAADAWKLPRRARAGAALSRHPPRARGRSSRRRPIARIP